jgi:hypothetical protein
MPDESRGYGMTIQDWGAIGEAIGGIAVLFTLVYLALQLRRMTRAAHRQTYTAGAEAISRFSFDLAKNPELHFLYRRALREPDAPGFEESAQAHAILDSYFSLMEGYYLHNIEYGEKLAQERWSRILRRLFSVPGGRAYWADHNWKFHVKFVDYINSLRS